MKEMAYSIYSRFSRVSFYATGSCQSIDALYNCLHCVCSQIDGVEYLLHEVYGLENKAKSREKANNSSGEDEDEEDEEEEEEEEEEGEGEEEDLGAECVVCITDVRDTLLLPCRHFCRCAAGGEWRHK